MFLSTQIISHLDCSSWTAKNKRFHEDFRKKTKLKKYGWWRFFINGQDREEHKGLRDCSQLLLFADFFRNMQTNCTPKSQHIPDYNISAQSSQLRKIESVSTGTLRNAHTQLQDTSFEQIILTTDADTWIWAASVRFVFANHSQRAAFHGVYVTSVLFSRLTFSIHQLKMT